MTHAELEKHIQDLGLLMVAAYNRYEVSGCFADRGEADGLRLQLNAAIASRSPVQADEIEQARRLAA